MDFALYRTIAAQGGVFTTAQARDSHSEWEIRQLVRSGRWRFIDGALPAPELQIRVGDDGAQRYLDTGWPERRVGAEFDGLEAHMTAKQLQEDRRRHNWLTDRRWELLHFTSVDVYRRPAEMIATTAAAFGLEVPLYPGS